MSLYQNARLLLSAAAPRQFPTDVGAEVAMAGRSNAGKSTAINVLTGRRALARTSKQPGRTRLLNFFELREECRLVDLPGYGYAVGAREEQPAWAALTEALAQRQSLRGMLLLVDVRRGWLAGDEQLLRWAGAHDLAVHVLLSKADQLSRSAALRTLDAVNAQLAGRASAQLFSAKEGTGVEQAREQLASWLALETPARGGRTRKSPGSSE